MKRGVPLQQAATGGRGLETGAAGRALPDDLLEGACRRLGISSLVLGGLFLSGLIGKIVLTRTLLARAPSIEVKVQFLVCIALSLAMVLVVRGRRFSPRTVLDLGLVYAGLICVGIAVTDVLRFVRLEAGQWGISWVCVMAVVLPFLIPMPPGKTMIAAFLFASTSPVVYLLVVRFGLTSFERFDLLRLSLPNYVAAAMAVLPAVVLRRLERDVGEAREMGSYRLVELLGRGGMGEVWRAEHRMLARPAAIKLIRPELAGGAGMTDEMLARFEREAQATASLQSPRSVELYDFGVAEDGTFYYVMELLQGLDMESMVERFGSLDPGRVVFLLHQVCDSLADAHHTGLVHRDVKPANIFVCRKGLAADFVKVLDFGLVQWRRAGALEGAGGGMLSGTPAYMAPETAAGEPEDARTDLYAVGCVAYKLLTGQLVFPAATAPELLRHHLETVPEPPSAASEEEIPEALDRAVLACLEKDPARRPGSAGELARMLDGCAADSPWTPQRADAWWQKHLPDVGARPLLAGRRRIGAS